MIEKEIKNKRTFVLRLKRGEEVISSISNFCNKNNIQGGIIQGVGALSKARIYNVQNSDELVTKETVFKDPIELVSALGNITTGPEGLILHIHVCLGFPDHSSKAGHLLEGLISHTGEFFIQETERITKEKQGKMFLISAD